MCQLQLCLSCSVGYRVSGVLLVDSVCGMLVDSVCGRQASSNACRLVLQRAVSLKSGGSSVEVGLTLCNRLCVCSKGESREGAMYPAAGIPCY